jgi:hypothetical protein
MLSKGDFVEMRSPRAGVIPIRSIEHRESVKKMAEEAKVDSEHEEDEVVDSDCEVNSVIVGGYNRNQIRRESATSMI